MELQTQAIDRVLDALAPALGAELNRILREARQNLELEFENRLQVAVREAAQEAVKEYEITTRPQIETRVAREVAEARELERRQVTEELQAQFSRALQESADQLRAGFADESQKAAAEWTAEREGLNAQLEEWRLLAEAEREFAGAGSQTEMLVRFMNLANRFAPSVALYISKADGLALWKFRGNAAYPPIVSPETSDPERYFRQIATRDKLVAAVSAAPPYRTAALDFLSGCLERSIGLFGLKLRTPAGKSAGHASE